MVNLGIGTKQFNVEFWKKTESTYCPITSEIMIHGQNWYGSYEICVKLSCTTKAYKWLHSGYHCHSNAYLFGSSIASS